MNSRSGSALIRLFLMTAAVFGLIGAIYYALLQVTETVRCADQLTRIYQAIELFEMDRGSLPKLAFYPDEPLTDPDSIRVVLEEYGVDPAAWICPASHPKIAQIGLSYAWNTRLNGANLKSFEQRQWMLVEINAMSDDVPSPHFCCYNVLFTDGTVERIHDPARELEGF